MRVVRRLLPSPRTWRGKVGIAAFFTAFLVLASTTAGYAYWQSTLTATSTVGAADLTISASNLTGTTFGNESLVSAGTAPLVSTGSITAQNSTTSSSTRTAAVSLTVSGSGVLASKITRQIWTTTNVANCTASATVPAGTPAAVAWTSSTVLTSNLAPQTGYAYYCVRSTIASRESVQTSGGSQSFTANVSGTIALNNFSGSVSAAAIQKTMYVYPSATPGTSPNWIRPNFDNASYNYCLDVSGGVDTAGTIVISYGCKTAGASNQQWKFTASGVAGYYTITPTNAPALRIDNNSSSATGGGVIVDTAGNATTGKDQLWQVQTVSGGVYQFVNSYSGMCMTSPSGADQNLGQITQTPCNGSQYQQFLISQAFENFTCKTVNNFGSATDAFTWSWTSAATGPYDVYVTRNGTTTKIVSTATTAVGVSILYSTYAALGQGTYSMTFVDSNGTLVGLGSATVGSSISNSSCGYTDPAK